MDGLEQASDQQSYNDHRLTLHVVAVHALRIVDFVPGLPRQLVGQTAQTRVRVAGHNGRNSNADNQKREKAVDRKCDEWRNNKKNGNEKRRALVNRLT